MKVANIRRFIAVLSTLALVSLAACGEKKEEGAGEAKAANKDATGATATTGAKASTGATGATAGTGAKPAAGGSFPTDICSWKVNEKGGCMTCVPRDLELLKCVRDLKAGFAPETDCSYDDKKELLTCETGTNEDFSWDLAKKTRTEEIYEKLPFLLAGAKFLLAEKFKDEKKRDIILGALEIFEKNAALIFNSGDVTPIGEAVAELAKKAKPGIKEEELQSIKTQLTTTINGVNAKRKNGEFADADAITLLAGFVTNLPADLIGSDASGIDLSVLSDALAKGSINDLLGTVVGEAAGTGASGATGATGATATTGG